jgi:hypothetical protein
LPDNTKVKVETPAAPGKESDEAEGKESKNKNPQSGSGL